MGRPNLMSRLPTAMFLVLALAACSRETEKNAASPSTGVAPPPIIQEPIDRRALLTNAAAAAAAYAAGLSSPPQVAALAGRPFRLRIAIGCGGRRNLSSDLRMDVRDEGRTLQLSAKPRDFTGEPWLAEGLAIDQIEAVEGFWVPRPWMLAETCPPDRGYADAMTPALPEESIAVVEVFEKGGSRLRRRGDRGYDVTRRLEPGSPITPEGLRLVLEGRLTAQRAPIRCFSHNPDARPMCLIDAVIDRVAFEEPQGRVVTEWRPNG